MNKIFVFVVVLLLFLATILSLLFINKPVEKKINNNLSNSLRPEQVVITFYDSYLKTGEYKNSMYLTEELKKKLEKQFMQKIQYDPIICSTQTPTGITVKQDKSLDAKSLKVTNQFNNTSEDHGVDLDFNNNSYKISNINCNIN